MRDGRLEAAVPAGEDPRQYALAVRAEMSRLRRNFAGILAPKPYRFADDLGVQVIYPEHGGPVLPHSLAPGVRKPSRPA